MLKPRLSLIPVVLAVIALALAACQTTKSSYFETPQVQLTKQDSDLFASALKEQKEGRLDKAAELWEKFLAANPRSYEAYSNLGMTLYSNDKLSESIKWRRSSRAGLGAAEGMWRCSSRPDWWSPKSLCLW